MAGKRKSSELKGEIEKLIGFHLGGEDGEEPIHKERKESKIRVKISKIP